VTAADPSIPRERVVLVGMMGSGKSSIGRELAARTGWPYHDNDDLLETATGQTAKQVLADGGEAALRAAEERALVEGLRIPPPTVIAVAAGTVTSAANRDRLRRAGFVVWLDAAPEVLAARAVGGGHRPWLDDDPVAWFSRVHRERAPWYRDVAVLRIDTGALDVDGSVDAIVRDLSAGG
jgi:shikimate kinase